MRSLSQPRSDLALQQNHPVETLKNVISPQANLKQRPPSKAYGHNSVIAQNTRDILRTENDDPRYPVRNSHLSSTQESPNVRQYRIDTQPPDSWQDLISYQGNAANYLDQRDQRMNKMRTIKYKESLDKMIREEKMKKVDDKSEMMNQSKQNHREIEALMRMEKLKEQEEKKQYSDYLQQVINQKNSFNVRDLHQRYQSETELNKAIAQLRAYERYLTTPEGRSNKISFEEYKRRVNQNYFGENYRDKYRETIFKPEQVWNRPNPGFQDKYMEPERRRQLDDYINRSALKKQEEETFEIIQKKEASKRLQADFLMKVQMQLQEKAKKMQEENEEKKQDFRYQKENKRILEQVADVQKLQQIQQRKNYGHLLQNQMHAKRDSKYNSISLTPAEKAMNFRRDSPDPILQDNVMTVFPNSVKAHDRSVQLKYLDRWLEK